MTDERQDPLSVMEGAATEAGVRDLHQAIWNLTSELSLDAVLQKIADLSRELVGASYSALAVLGGDGKLARFITSGISQRGKERIGSLPQGKGVLGVVLQDGKPLRLPDLAQHPQSVGFPPMHPAMKSFLGVPIVFKDRVLGDLYLANKIGAPEFTQEDETLVTLFAAQAAVAMENARLFEKEARRAAQLDGLNHIGNELTRIFDLDTLLQRLAEMLRDGFNYPNVQVYWVDAATESIWTRAVVGRVPSKMGSDSTWPKDRGIAVWVAKHKETALANDAAQDPRYFAEPGFESSAELAVPVVVKGAAVAVINVDAMEPYTFDDGDVKTLETLADQLAVAIENIQLHQQQQDQSRRLAIADERDRFGRDLHDGVIQSIYAAGLSLEDIASRAGQEPQEVQPRIETVVRDLNQAIRDIRAYISDLRPTELQGRRLDEALGSLVGYLKDRAGVSVSLDVAMDLAGLSERYTVNLWHIFQEAFSNIEKYAKAEMVRVILAVSDGTLQVEIADDGVGFDPEQAELGRGHGLSSIKDRAERLGGTLVIDSAPGSGSHLYITLPADPAQTGS